jgi:hypothetical protein
MTTATQLESAVGKAIFTSDGESIGRVREVHGGYFAVDRRMAPDYWLSAVYIRSIDEVVYLSIPSSEVDEHKLDAPGLEPEDDEQVAARGDRLLTDEQALSQRERMERELAEQRKRLGHS